MRGPRLSERADGSCYQMLPAPRRPGCPTTRTQRSPPRPTCSPDSTTPQPSTAEHNHTRARTPAKNSVASVRPAAETSVRLRSYRERVRSGRRDDDRVAVALEGLQGVATGALADQLRLVAAGRDVDRELDAERIGDAQQHREFRVV